MLKGFQIIDVITTNSDFSFDVLIIVASVLLVHLDYPFKKRSQRIPSERLERKENAVRSISLCPFYNLPLTTENLI
jgi:Ca2+/Na+ antiporter